MTITQLINYQRQVYFSDSCNVAATTCDNTLLCLSSLHHILTSMNIDIELIFPLRNVFSLSVYLFSFQF